MTGIPADEACEVRCWCNQAPQVAQPHLPIWVACDVPLLPLSSAAFHVRTRTSHDFTTLPIVQSFPSIFITHSFTDPPTNDTSWTYKNN